MTEIQSIATVAMVAGVLLLAFIAVMLRRVVATNEVHIVQSRSATTSYGTSTGHGNTYYLWPSWVPLIGVTRIVLPVSVGVWVGGFTPEPGVSVLVGASVLVGGAVPSP